MSSLEAKRHTLAHLLAAAVKDLYEKDGRQVLLTLGPAIDTGFYYDIDFGAEKISEDDLPKIEAKMRELLPNWKEFSRREVPLDEAYGTFSSVGGINQYKGELIKEISQRGEPITLYTCGGFTDLCRGGHAEHPSEEIAPDSFKLDRIAGAYWRGDEKNPMLTRIYGLAFDTKEELDAYLAQREEAKKRDHRVLGKQLDLFTFSDLVGSGMPLFTPRGATVRSEIINYSRELNRELGFGEVHTPNVNKAELFKISGHY
ncbi:MAG: threonine--tRNA ligase, partial [Patescibacteria group bacterium]|nr:threonine--tRNA ligase [Patescibacteria group bacterium]